MGSDPEAEPRASSLWSAARCGAQDRRTTVADANVAWKGNLRPDAFKAFVEVTDTRGFFVRRVLESESI